MCARSSRRPARRIRWIRIRRRRDAGAFTDAKKDKAGRFSLANHGTIFLDEIGDVSPAMQVRLLRVLQERSIEPLGSTEPLKVDVRVVAATNKDLADLVRKGTFREDLFYRIRVIHLQLPPLRERREDIPPLISRLIDKFNRLQDKDVTGVTPEAFTRLMEYEYPGNIRELENIIEQAFVLCRGESIELRHLPPELRPPGQAAIPDESHTIRETEMYLIQAALRKYAGNRRKAARHLGIDVSTLYRKCRSLQIELPESDGRRRG